MNRCDDEIYWKQIDWSRLTDQSCLRRDGHFRKAQGTRPTHTTAVSNPAQPGAHRHFGAVGRWQIDALWIWRPQQLLLVGGERTPWHRGTSHVTWPSLCLASCIAELSESAKRFQSIGPRTSPPLHGLRQAHCPDLWLSDVAGSAAKRPGHHVSRPVLQKASPVGLQVQRDPPHRLGTAASPPPGGEYRLQLADGQRPRTVELQRLLAGKDLLYDRLLRPGPVRRAAKSSGQRAASICDPVVSPRRKSGDRAGPRESIGRDILDIVHYWMERSCVVPGEECREGESCCCRPPGTRRPSSRAGCGRRRHVKSAPTRLTPKSKLDVGRVTQTVVILGTSSDDAQLGRLYVVLVDDGARRRLLLLASESLFFFRGRRRRFGNAILITQFGINC